MRRLPPLILICLIAPALSGCASVASGVTKGVLDKIFEPSATSIEVTIQAAEDINPDYAGTPSPLVVRIYELKSPTAFNNAGFYALYDSDAAALGDDLLWSDEMEFEPGEVQTLEREVKLETRYVGVMAAYQDIENASWRAVAEIEQESSTDVIIGLERLKITIETD